MRRQEDLKQEPSIRKPIVPRKYETGRGTEEPGYRSQAATGT
jgi:hypothetical protein